MGIWSRFFRKLDLRAYPDPLTISDWLENLFERLSQHGEKILDSDPKSPAMLSYFTLLSTIGSSRNTLHLIPESGRVIGRIFRELRLYYECLWQLTLLAKYGEEGQKIEYLYGMVEGDIRSIFDALFSANPRIAKLLRCVVDKSYHARLLDASNVYINAHPSYQQTDDNRPLFENIMALATRVSAILSRQGMKVPKTALVDILSDDTFKNLGLRFLTEFDFKSCDVLELPDEFYL